MVPKAFGVFLLVVIAATATPITESSKPKDVNFLEFDPETDLMDKKAAFNTEVPCKFCNTSLTILLELCKATNGRSADNVEDFLTKCTEIGGLSPCQKESLTSECSDTEMNNKRVNILYQRRLRCSKIYSALVDMYNPYDPCQQARTDFQKHTMTVCKSAAIDCQDPSMAPPASAVSEYFIPPYETNSSVPFQPPPGNCLQYVRGISAKCKETKKKDFYAKTNLDGYCNATYAGIYQKMGCEFVRHKLIERDSMMDVCSGLKALPIERTGDFCSKNIGVAEKAQIPLQAYNDYMNLVKLVRKEHGYYKLLNTTRIVPRSSSIMIP